MPGPGNNSMFVRICNGLEAMINCVAYYLPYHVINIHKIVNCLNSCRPQSRAGRRQRGLGRGRCYEVCDLPPVTLAGGRSGGRGRGADVFLSRHMSPGQGRGWVMGRAVSDLSRSCTVPGEGSYFSLLLFQKCIKLRHYAEPEQAFKHGKSM